MKNNIPAKSPYDTQAETFLTKHGISFEAVRQGVTLPPWAKKGDDVRKNGVMSYTVTLRKGNSEISFPFYNSINDTQKNIPLRAYSVLACCSSDINCPSSFEEFCSEYGYDTDSRKALNSFLSCSSFATQLRGFFRGEEIRKELAEIS